MRKIINVVAACALFSCDKRESTVSNSSSVSVAPPSTASTVAVAPSAGVMAPSADAVIAKLKASSLPISDVVIYTDANDLNHLLGRPHQYVAKAAWKDSRVKAEGDDDPGTGTGGTFEIFASDADAKKRGDYLEVVTSQPLLAEYDFRKGLVLIRLSKTLTPSQAKEYEAAIASF